MVNKTWYLHGGLERHMFEVKQIFEERGHEVVAFAMEDERNEPVSTEQFFVTPVEFRGGTSVERIRSAERALVGTESVRRLRQLLASQHIDAAHVLHGYHQLGPAFMQVLKRAGIPTVVSMHDYKMGCPSYRLFNDATGQICTRCFDRRFDFAYAPAVTRCWDGSRIGGLLLGLEAASTRLFGTYSRVPDAVMTVNQLQAAGALRMGVPPSRVHVVPHFAEIDDEEPVRIRDSTGVTDAVLYVGRLVPEKGVDVLIRAAARDGFAARIAGDGRIEDELRALAVDLGADVTFLGRLSHDDVRNEMRRAAALVVPSVWHEVWGLVINEAFDAGLPVIGTQVGAIEDLLGHSRGVLVPPGDHHTLAAAVRAVIDDPSSGREMASRARRWADAELSRERFIDRLCEIWQSAGVEV
jgi:glycosyltransferase involved in cell wall biosynthesis